MKPEPLTKFDKRNTATSFKLLRTPWQHIFMSMSFLQFMANLANLEAGFQMHGLQNLYFH